MYTDSFEFEIRNKVGFHKTYFTNNGLKINRKNTSISRLKYTK